MTTAPDIAPAGGFFYELAAECTVPGFDKTVLVLQPQLGHFRLLSQALEAMERLGQPNLRAVLIVDHPVYQQEPSA